jgi:hypothetical protein
VRTAIIRYTPGAVGLMEIENVFRYPALAVGLKPSAMQGEARLRGLERIMYSKTITQSHAAAAAILAATVNGSPAAP